jgi:hypothetical protein
MGRPRKIHRPVLTSRQFAALEIDVAHGERRLGHSLLGRIVGESRQAIYKWRKDPVYMKAYAQGAKAKRQQELEEWAAEITEALNRGDLRRQRKTSEVNRLIKNRQRYWDYYINKHWKGPVRSPIDQKWYVTKNEFLAHCLAEGTLPFDEVAAALKNSDKS